MFYNRGPEFRTSNAGAPMRLAPMFVGMIAAILCTSLCTAAQTGAHSSSDRKQDGTRSQDWPIYGGTPDNNHYSALAQINRKNVKRLRVAWRFDTKESGGLQTSPIVIDGVPYGLSP